MSPCLCVPHRPTKMRLNPIGAPKTLEPESAVIRPSTAVQRAPRSPPTARGPLPAVRGARGPAGRSWGHRQGMLAHPSVCRPPPPWNPQLLRAEAGSPARRGPSQASDFMLQASIPRTPAGRGAWQDKPAAAHRAGADTGREPGSVSSGSLL